MFREALKTGYHNLRDARDKYKDSCRSDGMMMNGDLLWRFIDVQTLLIAPICPHYAEHVWKEILKKDGFVVNAGWPVADSPNLILTSAYEYLKKQIESMRKLLEKTKKPRNKAATPLVEENKRTAVRIYVNEHYDGGRGKCLRILQSKFDRDKGSFAPDQEILEALKANDVVRDDNLAENMGFWKFKKNKALSVGPQFLDLKLPFGEIDVLGDNSDLIKRKLSLDHVEIFGATDEHTSLPKPPKAEEPVFIFLSNSEFSQTRAEI